MRLIVALLFLVSFFPHVPSHAEPLTLTIAPQLWEFKKDGRHFYVLGSLHSVGARYFPQWVLKLAAQSSKLVFEIDSDPAKKEQPDMALPEGQTLESLLSPEAWKKLMAEIGPHLKPEDLPQVQRLNPLGAYMFITEFRREFTAVSSNEILQLAKYLKEVSGAMDYELMDMAREGNIPIGALELASKQIEALPVGVSELETLIMDSPEETRVTTEAHISGAAALAFKFFDGDIPILKSIVREFPKEAYQKLFSDRNYAWIPKLEELPDNAFVMAGAGHLMGREGLLALMHARGWQVKRIQGCEQLLGASSTAPK